MSWMDSWSRPSKSQATPPPLYLTVGDTVPYCHSCGRVISQRKSHASQEVKYCSARCRNQKPGPLDRKIESVFAQLLDGASPESLKDGNVVGDGQVAGAELHGKDKKTKKKKATKGDPRVIVECSTVEDVVFPRHKDPNKVYGRRKNRAPLAVIEKPEDWRSIDMVDTPTVEPTPASNPVSMPNDEVEEHHSASPGDSEDDGGIALESQEDGTQYGYGGGRIRPPQIQSDVNGSVGGEKGWAERIDETDQMRAKRQEGQRRAEEREMVRRAARRGCAFGYEANGEKRKCEAVMKGAVVESSFAKGEWGIRWREAS